MYSTCLFCNAAFGRNEVIETFPVGRRLAFDAERGRLWVVCRACERWNLSPLEERWEAIEECERTYSESRLRVSTENVGLAKQREGLELVRIGRPQRPELAAWRYGDQFGRRRRRAMLQAGLGLGALGAVVVGGMTAGIGLGGAWWWLWQGAERIVHGSPDAVVARIPTPGGLKEIRRKHLAKIRLHGEGEVVRLVIPRRAGPMEYAGEEAVRVAGMLLPPMNRFGGTRSQVSDAVGLLERSGDVHAVFRRAAARDPYHEGLKELPYAIRLALEMAAHEETERRVLEGELELLERAWREAEEIAEISDNLLVPASVDQWLKKLREAR